MKSTIVFILLVISINAFAQTPVVENVRFEQRTDGSLKVDIYYDVTSVSNLPLEIIVEASGDEGTTWDLPCTSLTGDVGEDITSGTNKHVVWDFYADNPDTSGFDYQVQVTAHCMVCGQTITENYTLTRNLNCPPDPAPIINIGASNLTLDLGGFTIKGDFFNGFREYIIAQDFNGITIKNGTLDGFGNGIILGESDSSWVENMTFKNLDIDDPYFFVAGIVISRSQNVQVKNCQFEFLPVFHKGAINLGNSSVKVDSITLTGGGTGVDFGGNTNSGLKPSCGSVSNSIFEGATIAGVLAHYADSVKIYNNVFRDGSGIYTDASYSGGIRRIYITNNEITNTELGVLFYGTIESEISNNTIYNNNTKGIALVPNMDCGTPGFDCFYSTKNLISNNVLWGNEIDLYHDEKCLGNTWKDNIYESAQGSEIYTKGPSTAKQYLKTVDSLAATVVADARLFFVNPWECDTTGTSMRWMYIYKSESQQKNYEFWVNDGKVFKRDSISFPWMLSEGFLPYTENWIDSDSAMVIAQGMGGEDFCNNFELQNIEMSLVKTHWFFWTINYVAQDTIFQVSFDATME